MQAPQRIAVGMIGLALLAITSFAEPANALYQQFGLNPAPCGGGGIGDNDSNDYYGVWYGSAKTGNNTSGCYVYAQINGSACDYCADFRYMQANAAAPTVADASGTPMYGDASAHRFCVVYNCGAWQWWDVVPTNY